MKKLLLLFLGMGLFCSCKKNNTTNSNNPNSINPQISNQPAASNTPTTALIGKWIVKKQTYYDANGLETDYINYYNANSYYLEFNSAGSAGSYSAAINSISGTATNSFWKIVDSARIDVGGIIYPILFRNSDSLMLENSGTSVGGTGILILSKKLGFHGLNTMEQKLNKNWAITTKIIGTTVIGTYTNSVVNFLNFGNVWSSTYLGWSVQAGPPIGVGAGFTGSYKVLNDSFIVGSLFSGKIDTITSNRLVISSSGGKYIMN